MKQPRNKQPRWRSVPDEVILAPVPKSAPFRAESLCPNLSTMERAALGVPEAVAIVDAYAFRFPVVRGGRRA